MKFDNYEEELKINPFDFEPAFPKVFKNGGFDAIVGNPPYGINTENYISEKYFSKILISQNNIDNYLAFIIKGVKLVKKKGVICYIIPTTWSYMPLFNGVKLYLIDNYQIDFITYFKQSVFSDATVETLILKLINNNPTNNDLYKFNLVNDNPVNLKFESKTQDYQKLRNLKNLILSNSEEDDLFYKIKNNNLKLEEITEIVCGITPYRIGKGIPKQTEEIVSKKMYDSNIKLDDSYLQYIMGRDFNRYDWELKEVRYLKYGDNLAEPRKKAPFFEDKIVIRQTSDRIIANIDKIKYLSLKNVHNLKLKNDNYSLNFILGILNSKLITWWYQKLIPEKGRIFAEVKIVNLKQLPIPKNYTKEKEGKMIALVNQMLESKKREKEAISDREKEYIADHIKSLDYQIDNLVYEMYGLSDEEREIVERR
jgi:adenine-specific DNA-methyltransferase